MMPTLCDKLITAAAAERFAGLLSKRGNLNCCVVSRLLLTIAVVCLAAACSDPHGATGSERGEAPPTDHGRLDASR